MALKTKIKGGINPRLYDPLAKKIKLKPPEQLRSLKPPPNSYDPNLDAQERAAGRGYRYLVGDTEQANQRADTQHTIDTGLLRRGRDRSLADVLTARTREGEQYATATADLGRSYERLGASQADAANAAGVAGGGTLAAALKARQANQAHDQAGLDTQHRYATEDFARQQQRIGEDFGPEDPNAAGYDLGRFGAADRAYVYGVGDRQTGQQRAGIELGAFRQDTTAQRGFQAAASGFRPPAPRRSTPKLRKKKGR